MIGCFRRTRQDEGFLSLWRGNMTNVIRYFPIQTLNIMIWAQYKPLLNFHRGRDGYGRWLFGNVMSGVVSGFQKRSQNDGNEPKLMENLHDRLLAEQ